jgi:hypothetical protein
MPHFDRHADASAEQNNLHTTTVGGVDDAALRGAAEALREVEVEAVQHEVPDASPVNASQLDAMNIDQLRALAQEIDVADRETITERDDLIAAIKRLL